MTGAADSIHDREEQRLIARVRRGDERAFGRLYRLHERGSYLLALRIAGGVEADAEDVVQEAWRRAVYKLSEFEGRSTFRTWLSSIVVRCALEQRRSRRQEDPWVEPIAEAPGLGADAPGRVDLERAFERLAPGFRAVLILHDVEGYRHDDIAEMLGVSAGTSKSQLSRARARMRELLGKDYARE